MIKPLDDPLVYSSLYSCTIGNESPWQPGFTPCEASLLVCPFWSCEAYKAVPRVVFVLGLVLHAVSVAWVGDGVTFTLDTEGGRGQRICSILHSNLYKESSTISCRVGTTFRLYFLVNHDCICVKANMCICVWVWCCIPRPRHSQVARVLASGLWHPSHHHQSNQLPTHSICHNLPKWICFLTVLRICVATVFFVFLLPCWMYLVQWAENSTAGRRAGAGGMGLLSLLPPLPPSSLPHPTTWHSDAAPSRSRPRSDPLDVMEQWDVAWTGTPSVKCSDGLDKL